MALLYTFYGDDFTGSTDVLEQLALSGVEAMLFLSPPTAEQLAQFPQVRAVGVAGDSRSRSPEWMSEHLPGVLRALQLLGAPLLHYKVCSTFDSSPVCGSIGRAIELGIAVLQPHFVPIVVGAPHLRRFVWNGRLFASAPDGNVHRIDRHPMSRHPVTPMREPDLRQHLAQQTSIRVGLIGDAELHTPASASQCLSKQLGEGSSAVLAILFDTVDIASLSIIGDLLWRSAKQQPIFAAGSSGLTTALITAWRGSGLIGPAPAPVPVGSVSPLLVMSGSCSAVTAGQVRWALQHGFHGIAVDPAKLCGMASAGALSREHLLTEALAHLRQGRNTVIYTALGAPTTTATGGETLGVALGAVLRDLLHRMPLRRVVLCGGDTSSHAVQQLGLFALSWSASLQPGAPLCRAHFSNIDLPRLELVLKGGQVGSEEFFAIAGGRRSLRSSSPEGIATDALPSRS